MHEIENRKKITWVGFEIGFWAAVETEREVPGIGPLMGKYLFFSAS